MPSAVRPWQGSGYRPPRSAARPSDPGTANGALGLRDGGLCQAYDPDVFFPPGHGGKESAVDKAVKRICFACPSLAPCRAWALANPALAEFGVWGGMTEHERRVAHGSVRS